MNQVIGQVGAFLMLVLIVTLAFQFFSDIQWIKQEDTKKGWKQVSIFTAVAGILYVLFGGLIYNYTRGAISAMDLGTVWNNGNSVEILANLQQVGQVSGKNLIFVWLAHIMGKIFFEQYVAASWYTSFFFALMACFLLWKTVQKVAGEKVAKEAVLYLIVFPGISYRMFIPDTISLYVCILMFVACVVVHVKNISLSEEVRALCEKGIASVINKFIWMALVVINGFMFYQYFTGWWKW